MEASIWCFVMVLLLTMQNGYVVAEYKLDSEPYHHDEAVLNSALQRSRDEDPKVDGGKTRAGAEFNTGGGHLCFLSGLLGHCRSGKKTMLQVSSIRARRNAELLQINFRTAIARAGGGTGGHGTTAPRGYKNHPAVSKHNIGSRTRPSSSLNFCMLVLAAVFYPVYHYNHH